jgi:hypothetical protein
MSFEILHFRGADKILQEKKMDKEIPLTMEYLNDVLYGSFRRSELLRQALEEMDWRPKGDLNILDGRRYFYKGIRKRVAIDGNFSSYEFIQDGLLRLQIGKDKGKIDMGILLLTSHRSDKSPYGSTKQLVETEVRYLYPTISLPVTIVLFDLGKPGLFAEMGAAAPDAPNEDETKNAQGNTVETKAPDPGIGHDDFQEKMDRIEQDGISTSGLSHMKRWKKTRKKVKPALGQQEFSDPLSAAGSM